MRILIACEFSGIVRDAFTRRGHEAVSCDLLPSESELGEHYQGDVFDIIDDGWDMMIAHPPCTYLANSGVRWLYKDGELNLERWRDMHDGAKFFKSLLNAAHIPRICIENPIMHKHAQIRKQDQLVQPWMFKENESKAVCLWLKGLPKLAPYMTDKPELLDHRVWRMPPGPDRQKERSRFFKGIARAMAEQWT